MPQNDPKAELLKRLKDARSGVDQRHVPIQQGRNLPNSKHLSNVRTGDKFMLGTDATVRETLANNQSTASKWFNGIVKMTGTAVGALAENTLGIPFGLYEIFTGGEYYNNWLGQKVDDFNEWTSEKLPNYYSQEEIDNSIWENLATANFWADKVFNGLGYSLGSVATLFLTGGYGAVGTLGRFTNASTAANRAARILALGSKASDVNKAIKAGQFVSRLKKGGQLIDAALLTALAESSVEARQTYNDLLKKGVDRDTAIAAANTNFGLNMAIVSGTNILQFGRIMAGGRTAKDIAIKGAVGEATIQRSLASGRFGNLVKGMGTEGLQEGLQFASNLFSQDIAVNKKDELGEVSKAAIEALTKALNSKEGQEAMLIGAIVGGGTGAVIKQRNRGNTDTALNLINNPLQPGDDLNEFVETQRNKISNAARTLTSLEDIEAAIPKGELAVEQAKKDYFVSYVSDIIDNGGFTGFVETLENAESLDPVEVTELFGGELDIKNLKERAFEIKKQHERIENKFPSNDSKSRALKFQLLKTTMDFELFDAKEEELGEEIADIIGPVDLELVKEAQRLDNIEKNKLRKAKELESRLKKSIKEEKSTSEVREKQSKQKSKADKLKTEAAEATKQRDEVIKNNKLKFDTNDTVDFFEQVESLKDRNPAKGEELESKLEELMDLESRRMSSIVAYNELSKGKLPESKKEDIPKGETGEEEKDKIEEDSKEKVEKPEQSTSETSKETSPEDEKQDSSEEPKENKTEKSRKETSKNTDVEEIKYIAPSIRSKVKDETLTLLEERINEYGKTIKTYVFNDENGNTVEIEDISKEDLIDDYVDLISSEERQNIENLNDKLSFISMSTYDNELKKLDSVFIQITDGEATFSFTIDLVELEEDKQPDLKELFSEESTNKHIKDLLKKFPNFKKDIENTSVSYLTWQNIEDNWGDYSITLDEFKDIIKSLAGNKEIYFEYYTFNNENTTEDADELFQVTGFIINDGNYAQDLIEEYGLDYSLIEFLDLSAKETFTGGKKELITRIYNDKLATEKKELITPTTNFSKRSFKSYTNQFSLQDRALINRLNSLSKNDLAKVKIKFSKKPANRKVRYTAIKGNDNKPSGFFAKTPEIDAIIEFNGEVLGFFPSIEPIYLDNKGNIEATDSQLGLTKDAKLQKRELKKFYKFVEGKLDKPLTFSFTDLEKFGISIKNTKGRFNFTSSKTPLNNIPIAKIDNEYIIIDRNQEDYTVDYRGKRINTKLPKIDFQGERYVALVQREDGSTDFIALVPREYTTDESEDSKAALQEALNTVKANPAMSRAELADINKSVSKDYYLSINPKITKIKDIVPYIDIFNGEVSIKYRVKYDNNGEIEEFSTKTFQNDKLVKLLNDSPIIVRKSIDTELSPNELASSFVANVTPEVYEDAYFEFDVRRFDPVSKPKSGISKELLKKIEEVKLNNTFIELAEDGSHYINKETGQKYQRVTSFISDKPVKENDLLKSSQIIGTKVDDVVRAFFAEEEINTDVAPKEELDKFLTRLEDIKQTMESRGEVVLANDIVLYNDEIGVAGTVDLLTYDSQGNVRIYDMKTMRGNNFTERYKNDDKVKYYSTRYGESKAVKHQKQLSLYRILLNNTHDLKARTIGIMPIEIAYNAGDESTTKLNLLKGIRLNTLDKVKTAEIKVENPSILPGLKTVKPETKKVEVDTSSDDLAKLEELRDEALEEGDMAAYASYEKKIRSLKSGLTGNHVNKIASEEDTIAFGEAVEQLKEILPDFIKFDLVKNILNRIKVNGVLAGRFIDNVIYLRENTTLDTAYHEAFHAVFRTVLPNNLIDRYLGIALEKIDQKAIDELRYSDQDYSLLSDSELANIAAEEYLANQFVKYQKGNKVLSSLRRFFDKLLKFIGLVNENKYTLNELFSKISTGEYKDAPQTRNKFNTRQGVNSVLEISPILKDGVYIKQFLSPEESRVIYRTIAAKVHENLGTDISFVDLIKDTIQQEKEYHDPLNNMEYLFSLEDRKRVTRQLTNRFEALDNEETIIDEVKKLFSEFGLSEAQLDRMSKIEETDSERAILYDRSMFEEGGFENISSKVRQYIGFTLYQAVDPLTGKEMPLPVDYNSVYGFLQKRLTSKSEDEMLHELDVILELEDIPETQEVLYRLFDETGYDLDTKDIDNIRNTALFRSFLNAFKTEQVKYIQVLYNGKENSFRVFDANVRDIDSIQVDRWFGNFIERRDAYDSKTFKSDLNIYEDATIDNYKDIARSVKDTLSTIGIDLNINYIEYSLLHKLGETESDIEPLHIAGFLNELKRQSTNPTPARNPFIEKKKGQGMVGRLKRIAKANAEFDEQLVKTTFQDARGKTRYPYVQPSYQFVKTRELVDVGTVNEFVNQNLYLQMIANNPELDIILKNFDLASIGDIREENQSTGATFKTIDEKALLLLTHAIYREGGKVHKIGDNPIYFKRHFFKQLEAKSTGLSVLLPSGNIYNTKNGLKSERRYNKGVTDRTVNVLYDLFKQEYDRIGRAYNNEAEWKDVKWKGITGGRALEFWNFKHIVDPALAEKAKTKQEIENPDDIKDTLRNYFENKIAEYKKLLDNTGLKTEQVTGTKLKEDEYLNYLGNFFMDDYIGSLLYNQLVDGDPVTREDPIKAVKRNGGSIAYGVDLGKGSYKVGYIKELEFGIDTDSEGKYIGRNPEGNTTVDASDGQGYIGINRFIFIQNRLGRLDNKSKEILEKIKEGEEISWAEHKHLEKRNISLNPIKSVHFDGTVYHKLSHTILTKQMTSYKDENGDWKPLPHRKRLHDLREKLELFDEIIVESGSKLATRVPVELEDLNEDHVVELENRFWRLQVETPSGAEKILHGTQLINLIDSEVDRDAKVIGSDQTVGELQDEYHNLLAESRQLEFDKLNKYVSSNNEIALGKLYKKFHDNLKKTGASSDLLEFTKTLDGRPMYNLNLPQINNKFEQLFFAHFSKAVKQKISGLKSTLMSHTDIKVVRNKDNGYIIPTSLIQKNPSEYIENGSLKDDYIMSTPKWAENIEGGQSVAEAILPLWARELYDIHPGTLVNSEDMNEILTMLGFRIPTQDKHSMIVFKVVDFLPNYMGSTIILPPETVYLAGEDFDIDSKYIIRKEFYNDGKPVLYSKGDYKEFVIYHLQDRDVRDALEEKVLDNPTYQEDLDLINQEKWNGAIGSPLVNQVFRELGLPLEEEFNKNPVKTKALLDNQIIDTNIKLYRSSEKIAEISRTPASLTTIQHLANIINPDRSDIDYNSPIGKFNAWKTNAVGKSNVGPAANMNVANAFLTRNKIASVPVSFDGKSFKEFSNEYEEDIIINDDLTLEKHPDSEEIIITERRKADSLSTVLSAMTDNAKHNFAGKLNLSLETIGPVLYLIGLGVGINRAILIANQPIVKEFSAEIENASSSVNTFNESETVIINKYKEFYEGKPIITSEELIKGLTESANEANVMTIYLAAREGSKDLMILNSILGLNKGFSPKYLDNAEILARQKELSDDIGTALGNTPSIKTNVDILRDTLGTFKDISILGKDKVRSLFNRMSLSIANKEKNGFRNEVGNLFIGYLLSRNLEKDNKLAYGGILKKREEFLQKFPEYRSNLLLKNLFVKDGQLLINTRAKRSNLANDMISDEYTDLLYNFEERDGISPNSFANDLFDYLLAKDNLLFTNGSFIRHINPVKFRKASEVLDKVQNDEIDTKDYEVEFMHSYFRHVPNQAKMYTISKTSLERRNAKTYTKDGFEILELNANKSNKDIDSTPPFIKTASNIYRLKDIGKRLTYVKIKSFNNVVNPFAGTLDEISKLKFKQKRSESKSIPKDKLISILDKLKAKTGIEYELDNTLDNLGEFKDGKVYINPSKARLDTPFHEYVHPFVRQVKNNNPELYTEFVGELDTEDGRRILTNVSASYTNELGYTQEDRIEESIVQAIGELAANNLETSFWKIIKKVWNKIKELVGINSPTSKLQEVADLFTSDEEIEIENTEATFEQKEYDQVLADAKASLNSEIKALRSSKSKNKRRNAIKIKKLLDDIEVVDTANALNKVVDEIYIDFFEGRDTVKDYITLFIDAKNRIKSAKSEDDVKKSIADMVAFSDIIKRYEFLDDLKPAIADLNNEDKFNPDEDSKLFKLKKIIEAKDDIRGQYFEEIAPLIADNLFKFVSTRANEQIEKDLAAIITRLKDRKAEALKEGKTKRANNITNTINNLKANKVLNKEVFLEAIKALDQDTNVMDYLFNPAISSADPLLATFAKFLKDKLETIHVDLSKFQIEAAKKVKAFKNNTGRKGNNVEKFNKDLYKVGTRYIVTAEDTIAVEAKNSMRLVSPFNYNKYYEEKLEIDKEFHTLIKKGEVKKAYIIRNAFKAKYSKVDPNTKDIINEHLEDLKAVYGNTQEYIDARNEYILENTHDPSLFSLRETTPDEYVDKVLEKINKGDYSIISEKSQFRVLDSSKLIDPDFKALYSSWGDIDDYNSWVPANAKGEYHKFLVKSYMEAQDRLPENKKLGYKLPSIPKKQKDRLIQGDIKEYLRYAKDSVLKDQSEDVETQGFDNDGIIPTFYTQNMDINEISVDLLDSILKFHKMSLEHQVLSDAHNEIKAVKDLAFNREVYKTNAGGKKILSSGAFGKYFEGDIKSYVKKHDNLAAAHIEAFIDMQVYGKQNQPYAIKTPLGTFRLDKISDGIMNFASFTQLGGNPLLGASNSLQARAMAQIESFAGEFWDKKNWISANKEYNKFVFNGTFIKDFDKPEARSKIGQIIDVFDPLQGDFRDQFGNKVADSRIKKLLDSSSWFFTTYAGEHHIAVASMIALMKNTPVIIDGEVSNLYEAYELEDGILKLKNVELTEESKAEGITSVDELVNNTRARLHSINKRLHGVYNRFDKATIQRHFYGRLLLMYRKFLVPGLKKRYKKLGIDQELGGLTEGTYNTFFRILFKEHDEMVKFAFGNSNLTELEKNNLRRASIEFMYILATGALGALLSGLKGDDDDKLLAYPIYATMRLQMELLQYTPKEMIRLLNHPTIAFSVIKRAMRLLSQIFDPLETYERDYGIFKKGDSKLLARVLQFLGISGKNLKPDMAIQLLQLTRN